MSKELDQFQDPLVPDFQAKGVEVIAISCDNESRAQSAKDDWGLQHLNLGYGLSIDDARQWGLYITQGQRTREDGSSETFLHSEPALYFVRPDGRVFLSSVQSSIFGRASIKEMLKAANFLEGRELSPPGRVVA